MLEHPSTETFLQERDFSLVLGGPIYQLLRRSHLAGDALELVQKRILVISLCCWLPLLALSALGGTLHSGIAVPFLFDLEVHVRFLVVTPLLIAAELVVHRRMRSVVTQFVGRGLIRAGDMARFDAAITSVSRLRNSVLAEVLLFVLVYGVGIMVVWRQYLALSTATWYATPSAAGLTLSPAGLWFGYVSLPIFQFLLCRWYFRIGIWARFLWKVSRLELGLVPTHPDRVGGLGFLSNTVYAFVPLLLAHGALLSGALGNRIFHLGARLPDFLLEIVVLAFVLICVVLGPLVVFAPQLAQARRVGLGEYGTLAGRVVRAFDAKWLRAGTPAGEDLLTTSDVQSLADLANSFEVVQTMRSVPFTKETVTRLAVTTVVPLAPLLLTMMPLEELVRRLVGVVF